jgi:uncharacterized OB-fold protein
MWRSIAARAWTLQRCRTCRAWRYPPGPVCAECLSPDFDWAAIAGGGEILSWTVFHRGYLAAYPPPYNVIAVRLDEGPIVISNLDGEVPQGDWIGTRVDLTYSVMPDGAILPRFVQAGSPRVP